MKLKNKNNGLTLLELLMVVGIAAVISVSALVFFQSTDESSKVAREVSNISMLSSGISNIYQQQGSYDGVNNAVIVASATLPDNMRGPGGNIKSPWKADGVTITPARINSTSYMDSFTITYTAVPDRACVDMVTKTYTSFHETVVNGVAITSVPAATTECSNSDSNEISWTK